MSCDSVRRNLKAIPTAAGVYSSEMLDRFLMWLSGRFGPKLVWGDVGFGNEGVILCCEQNATPCLFKVGRTKFVYAFRKYQLVHRMYPPFVDRQLLLSLACFGRLTKQTTVEIDHRTRGGVLHDRLSIQLR